MLLKFYKCTKTVPNLVKIGDVFISWDGERLYHENSTNSSVHLAKSAFEVYDFFNYFEEIAPVKTRVAETILKNSVSKIRELTEVISKSKEELERIKKIKKEFKELLQQT